MLWTVFVILLGLWLIGMATAFTLGGLIHLLLVLAVVALLVRLMQESRPTL
jgi:protein-S-isoprenylcysteine O-methyltransferase Ste14